MATNVTIIDGKRSTVIAAVKQFTAEPNGLGVRITAFAASLLSSTETYRVFIGTTATTENEIIEATSVVGPGQDTPADLINHIIPPGHSLWTQVSTVDTIKFRSSGVAF